MRPGLCARWNSDNNYCIGLLIEHPFIRNDSVTDMRSVCDNQGHRFRGLGFDPTKICGRGHSMFWPPPRKMSHSFILKLLLDKSASFTSLRMKMEDKLIYRRDWNSLMVWRMGGATVLKVGGGTILRAERAKKNLTPHFLASGGAKYCLSQPNSFVWFVADWHADIFCCYLCVFNVNFVPRPPLPRKVGVMTLPAHIGAPPLVWWFGLTDRDTYFTTGLHHGDANEQKTVCASSSVPV